MKIKFRGINKRGDAVFGAGVQTTEYDYDILLQNPKECELIQKNTAAQFVGYDKHGIEIYEGDKLLDYDSETVVARLIPFFQFEDVNNAGVYPVGYQFDIFTLKEAQDETN